MPKISSPTIAEHVAKQEAAVVDATARLFAERGAARVTLADIADAVGLARTSLYRYFPSKGHILGAWFTRTMPPLVEASRAIAVEDTARELRLERWLVLQLDVLTEPREDAMVRATMEGLELPEPVRADVVRRHRELYATLHTIIGDAPDGPEQGEIRALLVAGLVRGSVDLVRDGHEPETVRAELLRAGTAIAWG